MTFVKDDVWSSILDGKETYRSDLIEFIVPNRDQINDDNTEFITASNDPIPLNLPGIATLLFNRIYASFFQFKHQLRKI